MATLIYKNKVYGSREILTKLKRIKTYMKLLKIYLLQNLEFNHAFKKKNIFKMAELIFSDVW